MSHPLHLWSKYTPLSFLRWTPRGQKGMFSREGQAQCLLSMAFFTSAVHVLYLDTFVACKGGSWGEALPGSPHCCLSFEVSVLGPKWLTVGHKTVHTQRERDIYIYCIRFMPMISYLWRIELDWWVSWSCWRGKKDAGKYNGPSCLVLSHLFFCTCLNETEVTLPVFMGWTSEWILKSKKTVWYEL